MQTAWFRYVLEVEEQRSINKAAERLFISQSSLSKVLHELQRELGYEVFERSNHGVSVTPKGRVFLNSARRICRQLDGMEELKRENKAGFAVCLPRTIHLAESAAAFAVRHPLVSLMECSSYEAIGRLIDGRAAFCFISFDLRDRILFHECFEKNGLQTLSIWDTTAVRISMKNSGGRGPELYFEDERLPQLRPDESNARIRNRIGVPAIGVTDRATLLQLIRTLPGAGWITLAEPESSLEALGLCEERLENRQLRTVSLIRRDERMQDDAAQLLSILTAAGRYFR